jgi:hypothetical protein
MAPRRRHTPQTLERRQETLWQQYVNLRGRIDAAERSGAGLTNPRLAEAVNQLAKTRDEIRREPGFENDGLNWPHCDVLNWPHLSV